MAASIWNWRTLHTKVIVTESRVFNSVIFSVHLQYLYLCGTTAGKCCYGTGIWNPSCSRSLTPYWWSWRRCLHWEGPPLPAWCSTRPPPPAAAWTRALVDQIRVGRAWTPSELKWAGDSHNWGPGDVRTQLSASQHCTDQSAEAQHWLWPSPAPSPAFRRYVTSQPWSGHKYSVRQMLWYSALRSSSQPSRQVSHFCLSPHLFVYLNANLL